VALVIPDAGQYNEMFGPKIAQAGAKNYGPSQNKFIFHGFFKNWQGNVKFYIIK